MAGSTTGNSRPEAPRDFDARQLAGVVQQLEQQLDDEVQAQPGLFERHGRAADGASRSESRLLRFVCQHVRRHRLVPSVVAGVSASP